jgi:phosphoserine phosphatase RsbU/P
MVANESAPEVAALAELDELALARMRAELAEEVTQGLAGSLNLRRTALRLFTLIRPRLADWSAAVLPDDRTGALLVLGGNEAGFSALIPRTAVSGLSLDRVLRSGRTELMHVAVSTASADGVASMIPEETLRDQVADLRPADVVGLGLTARGMTLGALVIVRGQGRRFDDADVAFAERIAARAAIALDSARLYEERGRVAAALADSLRPPTLPEIDGVRLAARYRPAAEHLEIGGDFYDVHGSGDDWLLSLGDVCGKGVEAAALTGRTRQSIRTAAYFERRPALLLGAVNTVLYEPGSDFVTVLCARLRPDPGGDHAKVQLAAAGHPAPIVLRADGRVEEVDASGTATGVAPEIHYDSTTLRLDRGDTMLMYTDGIDEARGPDGFYGVERLLALLPPYAGAAPDVICEAVEQDVIEYLDGRPHDDMALLAVTCGK